MSASALTWASDSAGGPVPYQPASAGPVPYDAGADATARLNRQSAFDTTVDWATERSVAPVVTFEPARELRDERGASFAATTRNDIWRDGPGFTDRFSLNTRGAVRRADGSPLPVTPLDRATLDVDDYDLRYTRGWPVARGYTASGLEVSLTPYAGIGVGSRGGSAEAGATLRIGGDLGKTIKDGTEAFGQRARWYLYAAGSGTAVGYNFARNRDGDYARSGVSRDSGSFLGDASIGVALRKGDMQGSFGVVYRELEAEGLRGGEGFDRDVAEGLVAFQLSIKPDW